MGMTWRNFLDDYGRNSYEQQLIDALGERNSIRSIVEGVNASQIGRLIDAVDVVAAERERHVYGLSSDFVYEQAFSVRESARAAQLLGATIALPDYADSIGRLTESAYCDAIGITKPDDAFAKYLHTGVLAEFQTSAVARYRSTIERIDWMAELAPTVGRLSALAESTIAYSAFDAHTIDLLTDAVGPWSQEFNDDLGRATSLRVRRGLYRENRADSSIDLIPLPLLQVSLTIPSPQDAKARDRFLLAVLKEGSELQREHMLCFRYAGQVETYLRRHIDRKLGEKYGPDWFREVQLGEVYKECLKAYTKKHGNGSKPSGMDLLRCSVFNHLIQIVSIEYVYLVDDHQAFCDNLQLVRTIRNSANHYLALTKHDYVQIRIAAIQIIDAIYEDEDEDSGAGDQVN